MKRLLPFAVCAALLMSCSFSGQQLSADITQDPVVQAALNSKEGKAAQLLIDSGNRFVECIDAYNAYLTKEGTPIPADVVAQTRICKLSLEATKEEAAAGEDIPVVLNKVYHPSCNHIPAKEEMVRVEVDAEDMSTFAEWTQPDIVPTDDEAEKLTVALPVGSCQEFVQQLFGSEETPISPADQQ